VSGARRGDRSGPGPSAPAGSSPIRRTDNLQDGFGHISFHRHMRANAVASQITVDHHTRREPGPGEGERHPGQRGRGDLRVAVGGRMTQSSRKSGPHGFRDIAPASRRRVLRGPVCRVGKAACPDQRLAHRLATSADYGCNTSHRAGHNDVMRYELSWATVLVHDRFNLDYVQDGSRSLARNQVG
jgi:hypothetical protein